MRASMLHWRAAVLVPLALVAFGCSKSPTSPSLITVVSPTAHLNAALPAGSGATSVYLHGIGASANPATLTLDGLAPTAATEKYKDSPAVKFSGGNAWVEVGTWTASPTLTAGTLSALGDLQLWLGLKNSDDIGTNFDVRAEVYKSGVLVASGETDCISGITRNPSLAKAVGIAFSSFKPVTFDGGKEVLSLRLLTRIGTNAAGGACGGHANATGLRAYFDATSRPAMFGVGMGDATATVDITVLEESTGAPISGAKVEIQYRAQAPAPAPKEPKGAPAPAPAPKDPPKEVAGTTDRDGLVEFTNQPVNVEVVIQVFLTDGTGRTAVRKLTGFAPGPNSLLIAVAPLASGPAEVSVTVVEQGSNAPIPGALVNVIYAVPPDGAAGNPHGQFTDGNGQTVFINLPSHSEAKIVATLSDGSGRVAGIAVPGGFAAGANVFILTVPPPITGSLSGVVRDASTSGVLDGVQVNVLNADNSTIASAVTGADGSYSIGTLFVGTCNVTFSLAGYQPGTVSGVSVLANTNTIVDEQLQLVPNPSDAILIFRVTDSQSANGMGAFAIVTITYADGSLPGLVQTDGDGLAQLYGQPVGVSATISVTLQDGRSAQVVKPAGFISGTNPAVTIDL